MSDAPRKASRRLILAPYILVILLGAAWCGYWFVLRDRIEAGLEAQATRLRTAGYEVAWASRNISGFPFRFFIAFDDARIAEPGGWAFSTPRLEAETAAYNPNVIVFSAPQGVTLRRPNGRAYAIKGEALRMSVGGYSKPLPRVSIEGVKVTVATGQGSAPPALPAIDRFEAHIRPQPGDTAQIFVRADKASVGGESLLARIAQGDTATIGLEGTLSKASALHGSSWPDLLGGWSAAGGGLDIQKGGVSVGKSELSLRPSRLTIDTNGRISGDARLSLTHASDSMAALGAIGALPQETANAAANLALLQAGSSKALDATLSFRGGQTLVGPIPLGSAPRVY